MLDGMQALGQVVLSQQVEQELAPPVVGRFDGLCQVATTVGAAAVAEAGRAQRRGGGGGGHGQGGGRRHFLEGGKRGREGGSLGEGGEGEEWRVWVPTVSVK